MPVLRCKGLLFDLDGTLVDSLPAVQRAWSTWAIKHSLDPADVLERIHGKRAADSVKVLLPEADVEVEELFLRTHETTDTEGVVAMPGALELLASLRPGTWGIVTSGTSDVAQARMKAAGIEVPPVAVYGEDVLRGKPYPDPFLLGATRLGIDAWDIVAFEDTGAGLQSIASAEMTAVAVGYPQSPMIYDYRNVVVTYEGEFCVVHLPEA